MAAELPQLQFDDAAAWEAWLSAHHESSAGAQLRIAKKGSAHRTVSHPEALDVALCYGWIDARRNALDADFFLQNFTPRRSKSIWSKVNQDKVAALIDAGRMREAGHAEIARAKADGRWEAAYAGSKTIEVPDDLAAALAANPEALAFFGTLSSQNRYAILFRLHHAKRPETRARNITTFVAQLARHETVYPQPPRPAPAAPPAP
ncbi:YdeI/OmpD-associated family protein [Herbiconiux sp. 11R-BC]|uniref:YdeI/OmpD-associated family protein n=1 Tax=Herbiconiux sp. 11R-BC TaxID=3111637 RepID=UPI003C056425